MTSLPDISFGPDAGDAWLDVLHTLKGYYANITLADGTDLDVIIDGEDEESGRYAAIRATPLAEDYSLEPSQSFTIVGLTIQ